MSVQILNVKHSICERNLSQFGTILYMWLRVLCTYGAVYSLHLQGRFGRIHLLPLADGKCWKCRVGVPLLGTRRKAENSVLICTSDERMREKCGIDWRKSALIWVMDGRP